MDTEIPVDQDTMNLLRSRMETLEQTITSLRNMIAMYEARIKMLADRNDELGVAVRDLAQAQTRVAQTFTEALERQRAAHLDTIARQEEQNRTVREEDRKRADQQEERNRVAMKRLEDEYIASHERIVEETLSRIGGLFVRGGWETFSRWIWAVVAAAAAIIGGWIYNKINFR